MPARFDIASQGGDRHGYGDRPDNRPMFDEKVAQNPVYQWSEAHQQGWMETTKNYLIGRHWEMRNLLIWAENFQRRTITTQDVEQLVRDQPHMSDTRFDPVKASGDLWSYLNLNIGLAGKARAKFKSAQDLNGLDVWRRIVVPLAP